MAELRYNPLSEEWVMIASHRQSRPQMPKDWCPFCPGSGRVPDEGYKVLRYPNDFPALSQDPPAPDEVATDVFRVAPAYGRCEVLLYSDRHRDTVADLTDEHVHKLARMWRECFNEIKEDTNIKYVYIFENRGEAVGVTMPHPHGQVYGYSYIPKKLEEKIKSCKRHSARGGNLILDLLAEERRAARRILFENRHFTVYVPFYSPLSYGITVVANRPVEDIGRMSEDELDVLGETVRDCAGMYDALFDKPFPYMMCMFNAPVDGGNYRDVFQFHIEFLPPMRGADVQQFFASSETGAGAWCNPNCPEEKAEELRKALARYKMKTERV